MSPLELENPEIDIQADQTPFGTVGCNVFAAGVITHEILSTGRAFGFVYKAQSMTEIIAHVEAGPHLALGRLDDAL